VTEISIGETQEFQASLLHRASGIVEDGIRDRGPQTVAAAGSQSAVQPVENRIDTAPRQGARLCHFDRLRDVGACSKLLCEHGTRPRLRPLLRRCCIRSSLHPIFNCVLALRPIHAATAGPSHV